MAQDINALQQNSMMRAAMRATAIPEKLKVGTFSESSSPEGKTTRIKLFNTGIITKLGLVVSANVTIGTATASASQRAPWNVIKQIKLIDFEGTERVNCSGFELWLLNCRRMRTPAFLNNEARTAVSSMPVTPTAVATDNVKFYIEVPVAYDPDNADYRGAIFAQTGLGEMYLNITWNDDFMRAADDDGVYVDNDTTTVTVNSCSVDVFQHYLLPQTVNGAMPIPQLDLLTVYEIAGNIRSNANMANGSETLLNYPNRRSVIAAYAQVVNAGVLANIVGKYRLILNGNNAIREETEESQLMEQRNWINGDLEDGVFINNHYDRPIETAQYGQVQWGLTLDTALSGTYYIQHMFESMYAKGMTLPGLQQA